MEMLWIWLAVVAASLIIEFISMDMTSIWFAIAGLVCLILAAIGGIGWEIQLIIFIVLSAILLIFVRKFTRKLLLHSDADDKTNLDKIVGARTKLLSPITNDEKGTLSINGVVWNCVSEDGGEVEEGKVVEVVKVASTKLIVKKIVGTVEAVQSEIKAEEQKKNSTSSDEEEIKENKGE